MTDHPPRTEAELVDVVRAIDVTAPRSLHERIDALVAEHTRAGSRRRPWLARPLGAGFAAAALAVVAAALVLALGGGGSTLSVQSASAFTLRAATMAPPRESTSHRGQLTAAVDGVAFPYWEDTLGWRAVGQRTDRVGGRSVKTIFYADRSGRRLGYAIVAGSAPQITGGHAVWRGSHEYRHMVLGGANAVVWLRDGRLCIVSGRGVSGATLVRLASWDERGGGAA
jgi:hypothetical protein